MKQWIILIVAALLCSCSTSGEKQKLEKVPIWGWREYTDFFTKNIPPVPGHEHDPRRSYDTIEATTKLAGHEKLVALKNECRNDLADLQMRHEVIKNSFTEIQLNKLQQMGIDDGDKLDAAKIEINATHYNGSHVTIFAAEFCPDELKAYNFVLIFWWIYNANKREWVSKGVMTSYDRIYEYDPLIDGSPSENQ